MSLTGKLAAEKLMKGKISKLDVIYADAYELAVRNGYKGTIDEWLNTLHGEQGEDGKSAYELAKENGFKGTEEEWLASLVGAKGEKGDKGDKGDVGGIDTQFIATYGVTTNAEIEEAYQAGKQLLCLCNGFYVPLSRRTSATEHEFIGFERFNHSLRLACQNNNWIRGGTLFLSGYGDTMQGALTLKSDPTEPLHAATKQYVDNHAGSGGGVVTGTYVGHNQSGPSNPTSLTFDFAPKLLIIKSKTGEGQAILNLNDATEEYSESTVNVMTNIENGGSDLDYFHTEEHGFWVKVVGNTVSWYFNGATDDAFGGRKHQFSNSITYSYIAIGGSASGSGGSSGGAGTLDESGLVLADQVTGMRYKVYVDNGDLKMEEV